MTQYIYKLEINFVDGFIKNRYSILEIFRRIIMRDVWAEFNVTFIGIDEVVVENNGELYIWFYVNIIGFLEGIINVINIIIRAGGKFEFLTVENRMRFEAVRVIVNGKGYLRINNFEFYFINVIIDFLGQE